MAIFMNSITRSTQPLLRETTDKMYMSGQGHSKATFKPMYGDFFSVAGAAAYDIMSLSTQTAFSPDGLTTGFKGATLTDGSGTVTTNLDAHSGGISTTTVFKSSNGMHYSFGAPTASSANAVLQEFTDTGSYVRQSTLAAVSPHLNYRFLFENDTYIFAQGVPSLSMTVVNVGASNLTSVILVAIRKSDLSMVSHMSNQSPQMVSGNLLMVPNIVSLIELDPVNKKAVFLITALTNTYGGFTWNTKSTFTNCNIVTLTAESGVGAVSAQAIPPPAGAIPVGTSSIPRYRSGFDPSKSVTWGNKRTVFMTDESSSDANLLIYAFTYDTTDNISAATSTVAATTPRESVLTYSFQRHTLRVLERDTHFYVFMISNQTVKPGSISTGFYKPGRITVFKGNYSDPTVLTKISTFEGKSTTLFSTLNISGDFTQMMLLYSDTNPDIVEFNEASETFQTKSTLGTMIKGAMVDSLNRLWYLDSSNNLHLQGPSVGNTVRVGFKDPNLSYSSGTIASAVLVSCFNYMGDRVANNITVQLEGGAAVFSANNSTTLTVMSDVAGDLEIPITVSNNGYIRVIANMAL